jgi:hypothetical protein
LAQTQAINGSIRTLLSYRERLNTKFIFEANNIFNTRNVTSTSATA